ncbi:MAG: MoxR family ATPase [Verrucomicrobiota bacterium]
MKDSHYRILEAQKTIETIILGKSEVIRLGLCAILSRGHVLIEDVPGVGKTMLAVAISKSLGLGMNRIQFTSDLLPGDMTGNSIFNQEQQQFDFFRGPLFTQVVMADEVNRSSPKTQSALLEAMEEGQVTVDGMTYKLPQPFFVLATQNPGYQRGTFPLPESQLDRFMMKLSLGYPNRAAEKELIQSQSRSSLVNDLRPALKGEALLELQNEVDAVHVSEPIADYIIDILEKSRQQDAAGIGLSPRAGLALKKASQAWAFLEARGMVIPEDIQNIAPAVLGHRLGVGGQMEPLGEYALVEDLVQAVPVR